MSRPNQKRDANSSLFADLGVNDLNLIRPSFIRWVDAHLEIGEPVLLTTYAEELYARIQGYSSINIGCSVDELKQYLRTIISLRIAQVNRSGKFRNYPRFITIPATVSILVNQLGQVQDDTLGVSLTPVDLKESDMMPVQQFTELSQRLRALRNTEIQYATELPHSIEGDWHFMMMQNVAQYVHLPVQDEDGKETLQPVFNGHLLTSAEQSPVHASYALAAAFVEMQLLQSVFQPLLSYGTVDMLKGSVSGLVS